MKLKFLQSCPDTFIFSTLYIQVLSVLVSIIKLHKII